MSSQMNSRRYSDDILTNRSKINKNDLEGSLNNSE